jgi:outer membrane immunogenic protein
MSFKRELLASAAAVGLLAGAASASVAQPIPFSWTGFYGGVNAGYSWGDSSWSYNESGFGCCGLPTTISGDTHLNGPIGGFQAGYNIQAGSWVWGLETDFQFSGEAGSSRFSYRYSDCEGTCRLSGIVRSEIDWFGTVRGRAGWLVTPSTLVYTTGGLAYGRVSASGNFTDDGCVPTACTWGFSTSATNVGWVVGTGFEIFPSLSPYWSLKVEYLYMNLGSLSGTGVDPNLGGFEGNNRVYSWTANFTDNIVRFGVNYHFH